MANYRYRWTPSGDCLVRISLAALVKKGAFKFSSNAMYSFAFLFLWAIALLTGSWAALITALFQHAYIWVHWYCTEQPDMRIIYSGNK